MNVRVVKPLPTLLRGSCEPRSSQLFSRLDLQPLSYNCEDTIGSEFCSLSDDVAVTHLFIYRFI